MRHHTEHGRCRSFLKSRAKIDCSLTGSMKALREPHEDLLNIHKQPTKEIQEQETTQVSEPTLVSGAIKAALYILKSSCA